MVPCIHEDIPRKPDNENKTFPLKSNQLLMILKMKKQKNPLEAELRTAQLAERNYLWSPQGRS